MIAFPAFQDYQQLAAFQNAGIGQLFDVHRFPLKGNREEVRDFLTGNQRS
jgi:hypothetical protein